MKQQLAHGPGSSSHAAIAALCLTLFLTAPTWGATTLDISEQTAGALASAAGGDGATYFELSADYPVATIGDTRVDVVLTDDADASSTTLSFPLHVSAVINLGADNTPTFSYLIDAAPRATESDNPTTTAAGLAAREAELAVGDLTTGAHVLALQVADSVARATTLTLPIHADFYDSDGDGLANVIDTDDDNDGTPDVDDAFPLDASVTIDTDQDGIGDELDPDDDNDGIPDAEDADPTNVDHLTLGAPVRFDQLFVLTRAELRFTDGGATVAADGLTLGSDGRGHARLDAVDEGIPVDTTRDYSSIAVSIADARVTATEILLPFDAVAFEVPAALPDSISVSASVTLEDFASAQVGADAGGLLAVYDANFLVAGVDPFLRVDAELTTGVVISAMADRTVDDDTIPAFLDADLDDDGVPNELDAFPEDAARSVDTDGDGIDDDADTDDDNDGVPDTEDDFPLDPTRSSDPDTDNDGIRDSEDDDDDGDGVPDVDDIAPLNPDVSTAIAISSVEAQLIQVPASHALDNPSFFTGGFSGHTYDFASDGSGSIATSNGSYLLDWAIVAGRLDVTFAPGPEDAGSSFPTVHDLVDLGLVTQADADAYVASVGETQVEVLITPATTTFWLLADSGDAQRYWLSSDETYQLVNEGDRVLLFGSADAAPRAVTGLSYETRFLVTDRLTLLSADDGSGLPGGDSSIALPGVVVPDESPGRRVQADLMTFATDGTVTFELAGESASWQFDADGRVVIDRTSGGRIVLSIYREYDNGAAVHALATEGSETYAFFGYALGDDLVDNTGSWLDPFVGSFLLSSFTSTNPDAYDHEGYLRDPELFGYQIDSDGRAPRVTAVSIGEGNSFNPDNFYWALDGRTLVLTARFRPESDFYSECDPALDLLCMNWRIRRWIPLQVSNDRVFVLEWEDISQTRDPADPMYRRLITPRLHFYGIYAQDRDHDALRDIDELFAGLDPDDADSDGDGTGDAFDLFPLDASEVADNDGDGTGDNADADDDNDGLPDAYEEANGLNPLIASDAAADRDGDGLTELEEFEAGTDASDPNDPAQASRLINISTRGLVRTGDEVMIGGLVIDGDQPMTVVVRARGPSLADFDVPGVLLDPNVTLFDGPTQVEFNDNWRDGPRMAEVPAHLQPTRDSESVIMRTLNPGAYTAIVRGVGETTGIGIVEVFEVTSAGTTRLINISTRGYVGTGDDVLIGGVIISGERAKTVAIAGRGPGLAEFGVPGVLDDPQLTLYNAEGTVLEANDSWRDTARVDDIPGSIFLTDDREAVIVRTLEPGAYTAILRGSGGSIGVGIVEAFEMD